MTAPALLQVSKAFAELNRDKIAGTRLEAYAPRDETKPNKADIAVERDLLRLCELDLHRRGIEYLHLSFRAREKIGWPDLVFAVRGQAWAVELKSASGRVSEEQAAVHERLRQNGWRVEVVRSWEEWEQKARKEF